MGSPDSPTPSPTTGNRQRWLPGLLVVLGLCMIGGAWLHNYQTTRAAFVTLAENLLDSLGDQVEQEVSDFLQPAEQLTQLMVEFSEITRFNTARRSVLTPLSYKIIQSYEQIAMVNIGDQQGGYNMAFRQPDGSIDMQFIEVGDGSKEAYWVKRSTPGAQPMIEPIPDYDYDPRTRPWYIGALATNGVFWTDVYIFYTGEAAGITASQVVRSSDGTILGVIGIDLEMSSLSQLLQRLPLGTDGRAYILDGSGQIVARSTEHSAQPQPADPTRPLRLAELGDTAAMRVYQHYRIEGSQDQIHTVDDQRFITSVRSLDTLLGHAWILVAVTPESNFADLADNPRRGLALILCGGFGIGLIVLGLRALLARKAASQTSQLRDQCQRAQQRAQQLAALHRRSTTATTTSLEAVTELFASSEPCRRLSVWQWDQQQTLTCLDAYDRLTHSHSRGVRLRMPAPLTSATATSIFAIDVATPAAAWRDWVDNYAGPLNLSTTLIAPILHDDHCIGAACLEFTDDDGCPAAIDHSAVRCMAEACAPYLLEPAQKRSSPSADTPPPHPAATTPRQRSRGLTRSPIPSWVGKQSQSTRLRAHEQACVFTALFDNESFLSGWIEAEQQSVWAALDQWLADHSTRFGIRHRCQIGNLTAGLADPQLGPDAAAAAVARLLVGLRARIKQLETLTGSSADCRFGADLGLALVAAEPRVILLGEAVANARELAHTALMDTIHVSAAFHSHCPADFLFQERGTFFISTIGTVTTFQLERV